MSDERGFTLVELMVGTAVFLIVLGAIMTMVQVATHGQARVAERVVANQRGRPVMTRIMDRLHSACVSPGLAPVLEGSDGNTMIVYSKAGDAVNPRPDRYELSLASGVLSETVYPGTGGDAPDEWTFGAPSTRQLLDGVSGGAVGDPPVSVPLFRYFAYDGGQVEDTPLPTPLSEEDAASTVQVDVAFTSSPSAGGSVDPNADLTLADSATLRIEPASEDSAEVNLPCV